MGEASRRLALLLRAPAVARAVAPLPLRTQAIGRAEEEVVRAAAPASVAESSQHLARQLLLDDLRSLRLLGQLAVRRHEPGVGSAAQLERPGSQPLHLVEEQLTRPSGSEGGGLVLHPLDPRPRRPLGQADPDGASEAHDGRGRAEQGRQAHGTHGRRADAACGGDQGGTVLCGQHVGPLGSSFLPCGSDRLRGVDGGAQPLLELAEPGILTEGRRDPLTGRFIRFAEEDGDEVFEQGVGVVHRSCGAGGFRRAAFGSRGRARAGVPVRGRAPRGPRSRASRRSRTCARSARRSRGSCGPRAGAG